MKTPIAVCLLLGLGSSGWALDDPKKPKDAKPPLRFQERYGYQADATGYAQKTPKDTLESIVKAVVNQRLEYLMAHLADPAYVDGKVARLVRAASRVDESAASLFAERLGAYVSGPDQALMQKHKMKDRVGIVVDKIRNGSPAESAGMLDGDLLLFFGTGPKNMFIVANPPADFIGTLASLDADRKYEVVVVRNNKLENLKNLVLPDVDAPKRFDAFRQVVQETKNLWFEDAERIQELRLFARGAEWKIDEDSMRATGTLKQVGNRKVYLVRREDRWFLENRQTKKEK